MALVYIREEFSDIAPLRILNCSAQWLSLERCVKRLLDQWPALHAYFDKEAESDCSFAIYSSSLL